jgi:ketosteroid isomerase-like protein
MKKFILSLFACCFMATFVLAQASAEEAAIKKVIEAEKAALDAADAKTYKTYWAKVPYASFIYNNDKVVGDALWKKMDEVLANSKPRKDKNIRSNWNIRTTGTTAFVTFDQRVENQETQSVWETVEARYMEKISGEWKIVNVTAVVKPAK